MNRQAKTVASSWSTMLVVVTAVGFFVFTAGELGSSYEEQETISGIIDPGPEDERGTSSVVEQAYNLGQVLRQSNLELTGTSTDGALENAQALAKGISDLRMVYTGRSIPPTDERPVSELAREAMDSSKIDELRLSIDELNGQIAELKVRQAIVELGDHTYEVYFGYDSSELILPAKRALDDIARREASIGNSMLTIVSYADRSGDTLQNCELAKRRAMAVAAVVRSLPVPVDTRPIPKGEIGVPVAPDEDGRLEPANRVARLRFGQSYSG